MALHIWLALANFKATVAATQARQRNIETVRNFFSAAAEKARSAHMQPEQVQQGVSNLSDQELSQLALAHKSTLILPLVRLAIAICRSSRSPLRRSF
jgi:hypothetical protein